ncbi:hypothetical protein CC78DRAFT_314367 [Lojkania enalia]|uniref:Uncharacterized protein n=1 Tax=Lojkania enalia TaxID=147567 RepID=A0A9P4MYL2_9PLEO|nr:hypothetical protein CC78DRAFT_314367 [Didymosphaeria enalia]
MARLFRAGAAHAGPRETTAGSRSYQQRASTYVEVRDQRDTRQSDDLITEYRTLLALMPSKTRHEETLVSHYGCKIFFKCPALCFLFVVAKLSLHGMGVVAEEKCGQSLAAGHLSLIVNLIRLDIEESPRPALIRHLNPSSSSTICSVRSETFCPRLA